MNCPYCGGQLAKVRTDSPWEFDLWCCGKLIGTQSWAHSKSPPQLEALDSAPTPTSSGLTSPKQTDLPF